MWTGTMMPSPRLRRLSTSRTNAEILDELLTKWKDMGYRFGTLDELFNDK